MIDMKILQTVFFLLFPRSTLGGFRTNLVEKWKKNKPQTNFRSCDDVDLKLCLRRSPHRVYINNFLTTRPILDPKVSLDRAHIDLKLCGRDEPPRGLIGH